jgi:hypothetical protein
MGDVTGDTAGGDVTGDTVGDAAPLAANDAVVAPAWQIMTLAAVAKEWGAATMDHRKAMYARGVHDALLLIAGQTEQVLPGDALHPIYQAYLREV